MKVQSKNCRKDKANSKNSPVWIINLQKCNKTNSLNLRAFDHFI